ncbi:4-hydroxy-3-methylbut-2-enyl diphosphate reductase [Kitasatospora sp. MMS16-BH015]|uniref:4-hydroxy-3-methylbut-2-enyl diphosphate reductase n=1 Tax=Kitasatospora sp. MMS16-BH015 TaxID=2018025 RepID=UPI000CA28BE7|nr:4-hydroxy-3-methylbut-2-enyl diphosphate reductase [Kitasatospora sp. MMS16-BH015]AUG81590.1 4-hydroxy-3-methylbut-2-enyl diphosphate reductase [Kitasatospora sp. MMS16-BH015]
MATAPTDPAGPAPRRVLLPSPRSFCAGVERAIEVVERLLDEAAETVYVRKQIVHNTHVVHGLRERGAVFVEELDEVPDAALVVFSAHGVSPAVRAEADRRGLRVVDATCPLVTKVHSEARRFVARGDTVLLIGHAGHEEVEGTLGEAPGSIVLVQDRAEAEALELPGAGTVSYLTQTTLATDETAEVIEALRERFPTLVDPPGDDICYATTNRQLAVKAVLPECELLLVIGSANSSNSVRLVELARRGGVAAHLVDGAADIDPQWLVGVRTVGVTAGASAPPALVDAVLRHLEQSGPLTVEERLLTEETIRFTLPKQVRNH